MSRARVLALALVLLPLPARALSVHDDLTCPSETQLRTALTQHAPALGGSLAVSGRAGEVEVRWDVAERKFSRVVTVSPRDCAAAAETISLLVAAWQRSLPTSTSADPLDQAAHVTAPLIKNQEPGTRNQEPTSHPQPVTIHSEPKVEPTSITPAIPDPVDAGSGSGSVASALDAGAPPAPVALITAPPEPDAGVLIALADPPKEVPVIKIEPPPSEPEVQQPSHWHLAAGVNVSGALGVGAADSTGVPQNDGQGGLALVMELGRGERWAGQLTASADTSQSSDTQGQFAFAQRQTLALQAVARVHPLVSHPASAVRIEAGPLLERLHGWSRGWNLLNPSDNHNNSYSVGGAIGAEWEERVGPVTLSLGPEIQALQQTVFTVATVSQPLGQPVLTLPWFWAGLNLGLRANFF